LLWTGAVLGLLFAPFATAADRATEIARIHVEALGGATAIRALASMRMTGEVLAGGTRVPFTLLAARPTQVRMETRFPDRIVVQAYDGESPPWESDAAGSRAMSAAAAERFLADAEFDDPLVLARERGASLEFAGETEVRGRKLLRLLVSRSLTENVFILIDPATYLLAFRVQELTRSGRRVEVVTRYDDFRPVAGVLVAHEIALFVDGALSQQAKIDAIEPNPAIAVGAFARPTHELAKDPAVPSPSRQDVVPTSP
jgi:hypothetical protein